MPIDVNLLRAEKGGNPDVVRESERMRGRDPKFVDEIIAVDEEWRKEQFAWEQLKKDMNVVNKQVGEKKKKDRTDPCTEEVAKVAELKEQIAQKQTTLEEVALKRDHMLESIGNIIRPGVPDFLDEEHNQVLRRWGVPNRMKIDGETPGRLNHHQILAKLRGYDPVKGAMVAGHRGYYLRGVGCLLNMALQQYGIQFLVRKSYLPVQPPFFMKKEVMAEVAELKDFDETLYKIPAAEEKGDMFLIATSEQPLCALHRGEVLEEKELPIKYAGFSTCFRKEAGSHGRETWGIFRVHQFEKVEQFVITKPEDSDAAQEEMIKTAEEFYQSLDLPYQVISIVSGALNDAAARKYDLEAWFPGYGEYKELVSCSNCTDYQSRAMNTKLGHKKQGDRETKLVHMLNGTLVATTRSLCCILENYQTPEGVRVPRVLVPFMGGMEFLPYPEEEKAEEKDKENAGAGKGKKGKEVAAQMAKA
mmetsp:Transcript_17801/g.36164  ORF Transcript_17801/g.36164 Transcript_17801/m.36164 type:complete len:474 (+) Transcript_17801:114-1535(+)